ncbi:vesicle transport protein USE1 [Impatiens glandulifera]|uniref:vesicle transport protein USE1 n=1 Tax=Impatiens glandulifera TaxID=253017 RepID=UPI001FB12528|nr:vesicle transport protein USE1 [Impatiens glandulifera]XP_047334925.1 vesicle transport protein USE1 [Impatiens glandulifera]XP_047334926.1 vesicle transport protein USE1 [Impatiens glandulifera]XP_047334927.1 vesicle transport protein USE1 [Impatiens glandulifera]
MGISKTELNLRRLLASAPNQQNPTKLLHYVATLREQLEELSEERTPEGLPRISKAQINEYSENIQVIAAKLAVPVSDSKEIEEPRLAVSLVRENPSATNIELPTSPGLRRRFQKPSSIVEGKGHGSPDTDDSGPVKLDDAARSHIEKHRNLQEDLTNEMVGLARQLKESSQVMSQSLKNTEKILDSTEKAVEHSLASTGSANSRAAEIYSKTSKTTCFTWLLIFAMTCIFIMIVLLIRVT